MQFLFTQLEISCEMLQRFLKRTLQQTSRSAATIIGQNALFVTSTSTMQPRASEKESTNLSKEFKLHDFTPEESLKIVDIINKSDTQALLSYDISKARAQKLFSWKIRNGPLNKLDELLFVEGFGMTMATKFCKSLLLPPTKAKAAVAKNKSGRTAPYITPSMDEQQRQSIRSCVAVRIGVASVTWSHLKLAAASERAPCTLTDWQHHEIADKKLHLSELLQRCLYLVQQIPAADCYLLENPQMAQTSNNPGSVEQQNINIQKAQIIAVLSYALAARSAERAKATNDNVFMPERQASDKGDQEQWPTQPTTKPSGVKISVYYLRRFLTARLFNHLVGTERVSSEDTVVKLMRTHYNVSEEQDYLLEDVSLPETRCDTNVTNELLSIRGQVQFPLELRKMFAGMERYQREFLGQSLLLNLAFVRLVLLQDPISITAVSNQSSKKEVNTSSV